MAQMLDPKPIPWSQVLRGAVPSAAPVAPRPKCRPFLLFRVLGITFGFDPHRYIYIYIYLYILTAGGACAFTA